jgi:hypothetical protein
VTNVSKMGQVQGSEEDDEQNKLQDSSEDSRTKVKTVQLGFLSPGTIPCFMPFQIPTPRLHLSQSIPVPAQNGWPRSHDPFLKANDGQGGGDLPSLRFPRSLRGYDHGRVVLLQCR